MAHLHLPSLRGNIGNWVYFSTVMKVRDIVLNKRIITVAESEDLYTQNINNILQRELKHSRINKISEYLLNNEERFFNSLIVAIHGGEPIWSDVDIKQQLVVENEELSEVEMNFIGSKMGILSLDGNEEIFALDGQHRLSGIRKAFNQKEAMGDEEIPLILVVHRNELKERTRRLFTVLNKYAEKPRGAELIILDEDDTRAILTRRLVEHYEMFLNDNALSDSKTGAIPKTNTTSFTTLVTINGIHNILLKDNNINYNIRPTQVNLDLYYNTIIEFWDFFFDTFPEIPQFTYGNEVELFNHPFNRNNDNGGNLLLRPVGQLLFAKVYQTFKNNNELHVMRDNVRNIDFRVSGHVWNYLYWDGERMIGKEDTLKYNLFLYLLGRYDSAQINLELARIYKHNNLEYDGQLQPLV